MQRLRGGQGADVLGLSGNGVRHAGADTAHLHAAVAIPQHVKRGLHHLRRGGDAHCLEYYRHGVAQFHLLTVQLGERQCDGHSRHAHLIVGDVVLRRRPQLVGGRRVLKRRRQIYCQNAGEIERSRNGHSLLRQLHGGLIASPVWVDCRIDRGTVGVLLQGREILAVADDYATVCAPVRPQPHREAVKLVFAAVDVQDAALHAAQQSADGQRYGAGHGSRAGTVCPVAEAIVRRNSAGGDGGEHRLHPLC